MSPGRLKYSKYLSVLIENCNSIYCVSRDSNMDGVGSPALLIKNYHASAKNLFFMQQKDFELLLKYVNRRNPRNSAFIICDLSLNDDQIPYVKRTISKLKRNGNAIIWLDHHPWSAKGINAIKGIDFGITGENDMYCATELVYKLLCKENDGNRSLARMIHMSDFALKSKEFDTAIKRLSGAIMYFRWDRANMDRNLKRLSAMVAELDLGNEFIGRAYENYKRLSKAGISMLTKNMNTVSESPYKITLGFGKKLHTNQACSIIRARSGSDIEIYVDVETGKCGTRSKNRIDCSPIAASLNGGGHPQASGFVIDTKKFNGFNNKGKEKFLKLVSAIAKSEYQADK